MIVGLGMTLTDCMGESSRLVVCVGYHRHVGEIVGFCRLRYSLDVEYCNEYWGNGGLTYVGSDECERGRVSGETRPC
jgi:hypothetical protein